jgi:O-antigen/teichoic acid export membrane protein
MSSSGGGSSFLSTRLQRIVVYGLVIFAVVPLALGLLLVTQGNGAAAPFLTTYYVIAILGLAVIMFERLTDEIRKTPHPVR